MSTEKHTAPNVAQVKLEHNIPSGSRSLAALNILNGAIGKCQDNTIIALTENGYEQLVILLGELTDVVRDDEDHLLAPLMQFVFGLIENYERKHIPELAELG